jgi:xanthine dehydrogenase small subunit
MGVRDAIRFYLNDEAVELKGIPPDRTLLDYLRLDRGMTGTKEGCAEGDCGACTVLVGRVDGRDRLVYESMNACIRFLVSLDGTHVVTIERLASQDGQLHPVQRSMLDHDGSQCGFCTPGFVMSLYSNWLANPDAGVEEIERSIQGNLCRCTGYASIVRSAQAVSDYGRPEEDRISIERDSMLKKLAALRDEARVVIEGDGRRAILPADEEDLAAALEEFPEATIVAGATDVGLWVTKQMRVMPTLILLNRLRDMHEISTADGTLAVGACVSYSEAKQTICSHIPQLEPLWNRIGGVQVRNAGTIGGNIANGSPIGDTPPPLIALGATLTLRSGRNRRSLPLEEYFIAYGRQDRQPGEFIERIDVPLPAADEFFAAYKVSKRFDEDITSVLGAFRLRIVDGCVAAATISYGGMAGTPKRAHRMEAKLIGAPWTRATVEAAMRQCAEDFQPLTDWRASAEYRLMVAQNLLLRFWAETTTGEVHQVRDRVNG